MFWDRNIRSLLGLDQLLLDSAYTPFHFSFKQEYSLTIFWIIRGSRKFSKMFIIFQNVLYA